MAPSSIVLFKDPPIGELEPDAFVTSLDGTCKSAGIEVVARCVPVLQTTLNVEGVAAALSSYMSFDAFAITSHRAGEAMREAVADLPQLISHLNQVPVFVVGQRTADSIRAALPALPDDFIIGADSGNAEILASVMLRDLPSRAVRGADDVRPPSVLFLCGDKRLDVLPTQLRAGGMLVTETVAYTTAPAPAASIGSACFPASSATCTGGSDRSHPDAPGAPCPVPRVSTFVFFSPSGCEAALASCAVLDAALLHGVPCVALGPTTAQALLRLGVVAAGVARTPSPEGLAAAVLGVLQGRAGVTAHGTVLTRG